MPCFASTDATLYAIYDTSNSNNVIGYYSVRSIGGTNVYDIDWVYFTDFNGVINDAITTFINTYNETYDDNQAFDEALDYITNNISIESNSLNGTALNSTIRSWLVGYVNSNFNLYSSYLSQYYTLRNSYNTALVNEYQSGYRAGFDIGRTGRDESYYKDGYNQGLIDGRSEVADLQNNNAYLVGYNDGVNSANGGPKFIYSFFSAPFVFMRSLFNFEIFGVNFYQIVLTLLSMVLVFFVLKFILSKVS